MEGTRIFHRGIYSDSESVQVKGTLRSKRRSSPLNLTVMDNIDRKTLGDLIRTIRIERNINQDVLSKQWGMSQGSVSKIENGELGLDLREVYDFCIVVEIPMQEFAGRLAERFAENDHAS